MTNLHILGGGPAGLAAAHYAHQRGLSFALYEAGGETGGNCRTLRIGPSLYDTGAHRLHARDPEVTGLLHDLLGDKLISVKAPSRIVRGGATFAFPPEAGDLLRNLTFHETARAAGELLYASVRRPHASATPPDFRDLALRRYGPTLAGLFLLDYTRKLWGRDPARLSPAVAGGRLEGLNVGALFRKKLAALIVRPFRKRSLESPSPHLDGRFLYPKDGIGSLFRSLESRLPEGSVHTNSRVTRIRHQNHRILGVTMNDAEEIPVENVVSTLPLPAFLRALDPPPPREILEALNALAFRNLILCVVRLKTPKHRYTENASLYFPEASVPFTRLYEPRNRSDSMSPPGETCLVLEIPCDPDDHVWRAPDEDIANRTLEALAGVMGPLPGDVLETRITRLSHAYPVLENEAVPRTEELAAYCRRFTNLRLAGRNALFRYAHIHDMFRQARLAVEGLSKSSDAD